MFGLYKGYSIIPEETKDKIGGNKMPRYRVHIYAIGRVPVDVEADSAVEAVKKAERLTNLYDCFDSGNCEYAEEVVDYLVDELDDHGDFIKSSFMKPEEVFG